jgi:intracellular sulfur oxidation DsrE/DsrF family protein
MEVDEIQDLVDQINTRNFSSKEYQKMKIEEISAELRDVMKFQQESFQKIEELEKKGVQVDLIKYAKVICNNTIEREIIKIQDVYLEKIENEYLKSKKK